MKPHFKTCLLSLFLLTAASLQAQKWRLVEDFEGGDLSDWLFATDSPLGYSEIRDDPVVSGNHGLHVNSGHYYDGFGATELMKLLPEEINTEEPFTIYWRFLHQEDMLYWVVRISDKTTPAPSSSGETTLYIAYEYGLNALRNGGHFSEERSLSMGEHASWEQIWLVVDPEQEHFQLWLKTREHDAPVGPIGFVDENGNDRRTYMPFTRSPDGPIVSLAVHTAQPFWMPAGPYLGDWLMDDIYIAQGADLREFYLLDDTWPSTGGWPVSEAGDVDTAGWLGHLNVSYAPWVWSWSTEGWLYAQDDAISSDGGWVFAPR